MYFPDGGQRIRDTLAESGEPILPLTEWALTFSKPLSVTDNWALNYQRENYRREYHALMKAKGVDVILCPVYPGVGALQHHAYYWGYTSIWNILDQPAVVFPTGMSGDREIDHYDAEYRPLNDQDEREWKACEFCLRCVSGRVLTEEDSPDLFHDVPITLQLAGKHFHDEDVLRAAKLIESILKA